jgi:hypothetical protein
MTNKVKHIAVENSNHLTATEKKHIKYLIENGYINMNAGLTSATANNKAYYFYSAENTIDASNILDLTVRIEEKQKAKYYQQDENGNVIIVNKNVFHIAKISVYLA